MRVVTYARVSTDKQGASGHSLVSQSQKFAAWCERGGHDVVRAYEERKSATTMARRRLFNRMLDELPETRPQMIVIDSADRFSRNLEDVFDVLKRLRVQGINIWPLEWERDDPPDIITYDSADYLRFREEIIAAQAEAKRIKTRILRSYAAKRERGATTTSRPPFGVVRDGDALVPSADAWVIERIDAMVLANDQLEDVIAWVRSVAPHGWDSRQGLWHALSSPCYVEAGVRTAQQQAELDVVLGLRRERFARRRTFAHEFAGVFACGRCLDAGEAPERALLVAAPARRRDGTMVPSLGCQGNVPARKRRHAILTVVASRVAPAWWRFIDALRHDEAAIARWAAGTASFGEVQRRRELQRAGAQLDQEEAALIARRTTALDLFQDRDPLLASSARRSLAEIERAEASLAPRRAVLRTELARIATPARNPIVLRGMLDQLAAAYRGWPVGEQNMHNRLLCARVGSHPRVDRDGRHRWVEVLVRWPAVAEGEYRDQPSYRTSWRDTVYQDC
jgi:DNA invertase Pin-like site-specific DNA recombinase